MGARLYKTTTDESVIYQKIQWAKGCSYTLHCLVFCPLWKSVAWSWISSYSKSLSLGGRSFTYTLWGYTGIYRPHFYRTLRHPVLTWKSRIDVETRRVDCRAGNASQELGCVRSPDGRGAARAAELFSGCPQVQSHSHKPTASESETVRRGSSAKKTAVNSSDGSILPLLLYKNRFP